jgi:hypothetical protein
MPWAAVEDAILQQVPIVLTQARMNVIVLGFIHDLA